MTTRSGGVGERFSMNLLTESLPIAHGIGNFGEDIKVSINYEVQYFQRCFS